MAAPCHSPGLQLLLESSHVVSSLANFAYVAAGIFNECSRDWSVLGGTQSRLLLFESSVSVPWVIQSRGEEGNEPCCRVFHWPTGNMKTSTVSRVVEIGLRACGIWPYLLSTFLYRLFWTVMLGTVQVLQYQYVVMHYHSDNFSDFMDGVSSTMAYTLFFIKLAILWANEW